MALLRLEAGPITVEKSASNAKADRVITSCALLFGYEGDTGDKQAVADFFMTALVARLADLAKEHENTAATGTALASVAANPPSWTNGS